MDLYRRVVRKLAALEQASTTTDRNSPDMLAKVSEDSLLWNYGNIHSQRGQDGILAKIFNAIGVSRGSGRFVEFGAWDGVYLSNSRWLYEKGWSGVFIEGNAKRFEDLVKNYGNDSRIQTVNAFVGAPSFGISGTRLSDLVQGDVDFLSIDVDGIDLEIFEDMGIRPSVVLIEGGSVFRPELDRKIDIELARNNIQHPLGAIVKTAAHHGYSSVCFLQDTYLVRSDLLPPSIRARSAHELYFDMWHFVTDKFRGEILACRDNEVVKAIETKELGSWKLTPFS